MNVAANNAPSIEKLVAASGDADALAVFTDPDECRDLGQAGIHLLIGSGVKAAAIGSPWAVRGGRVQFGSDGFYAPNCIGEFAFILAIIDTNGIIDIVAWSPATGRIGVRLGNGFALGQGQIGRNEIGLTGPSMPVHRTPIGWLRAGRRGLVIVDYVQAAHALSGVNLMARDADHAEELRQALRVRPPKILFRQRRIAS